MSAPLLEVAGLTVGIGMRTLCAKVDFTVRAGERWAIIGPNGAGKTTLLRTLAALLPPRAGQVRYGTTDAADLAVRERARAVALLPQHTDDAFAASALDTVLLARHPHLGWAEWEAATDVALALASLHAFGVAALAARDVRTLSGGERRRVALAALVAQQAPLLLLDEPSSHLDVGQQASALDALVAHAQRNGSALVMVLHDLHLASRYCDHVIAIGDGQARAGATASMLDVQQLSTLFGRALVELHDGTLRAFVPR